VTCSQKELITIFTDYIREDLIPDIKDPSLKIIASVLEKTIRKSPEVATKVLEHPMVSIILCCDDKGKYNVDNLLSSIKETMQENEKFYLYVPEIPIIFPNGAKLGLDVEDIEKLEKRFK
jgi:hypothetical protein